MKERNHSNVTFVIIAIDTFGRVFLLIGFPLSGGGAAATQALQVGCVAAVRLHHFVALI